LNPHARQRVAHGFVARRIGADVISKNGIADVAQLQNADPFVFPENHVPAAATVPPTVFDVPP